MLKNSNDGVDSEVQTDVCERSVLLGVSDLTEEREILLRIKLAISEGADMLRTSGGAPASVSKSDKDARSEIVASEMAEEETESQSRMDALDSELAQLQAAHCELWEKYKKSTSETEAQMQWALYLQSQLDAVHNSLTWRAARTVLDRVDSCRHGMGLLKKITETVISPKRTKPTPVSMSDNVEQPALACQPSQEKDSLLRGVFSTDKTLIISSHDASRTGAPLIILNIAQRLVEKNVRCLFLLVKGGELLEDFQKLGEVRVLSEWQSNPANAGVFVDDLVGCMLSGYDCPFALLNSSESHPLYLGLRKAGVRFIGLVHEFADPYPQHVIQKLVDCAEEIVFPSQIVYDAAVKKLEGDPGNISILPQGLFDPEFPTGDPDKARKKVLEELGLDDDTFIVLGCGYVDARKGCDVFLNTACRIREQRPDANIVFVWLGTGYGAKTAGPRFQLWLQNDLEKLGAEPYVRFVGARTDVAPWFHAADCLYMCSRQDPFPCVVLEAMAAKMPVICFRDATGSVDAIDESTGFAVPYMDIESVCEKLELLHDDRELGRKMGEAGRDKVLAEYRYDEYVDKLCDKIHEFEPDLVPGGRTGKHPEQFRKVIVPCSDWGLSGVNVAVEALGGELIRLGWDFRILFTNGESVVRASSGGQLPKNVPHDFLNFPSNCDQKTKWRRLIDHFERRSPCIMLTGYDYLSNSIIPALTDFVGAVCWNQSDDMEYYEQVHRLGRYCNKLVCVSKQIATEIEAMNPLFKNSIDVIPNGALRESELRGSKKVFGEKIRIIYAGRIVHYQKRVRDFVDLVNALDRVGLEYEFSIVGQDHDGSEKFLKSKLAKQVSDGRVVFCGQLNRRRMLKAYSNNDLFLLVSDFEGMPLSLTEAMGLGCIPVIADMKSGVKEIITPENGVIVSGRDYDHWAKVIKELCAEKEKLAKMSQNAVSAVAKGYTVENLAKQFDKLFTDVMKSVVSQEYERPKTLKWKSKTGDVLPPQDY